MGLRYILETEWSDLLRVGCELEEGLRMTQVPDTAPGEHRCSGEDLAKEQI